MYLKKEKAKFIDGKKQSAKMDDLLKKSWWRISVTWPKFGHHFLPIFFYWLGNTLLNITLERFQNFIQTYSHNMKGRNPLKKQVQLSFQKISRKIISNRSIIQYFQLYTIPAKTTQTLVSCHSSFVGWSECLSHMQQLYSGLLELVFGIHYYLSVAVSTLMYFIWTCQIFHWLFFCVHTVELNRQAIYVAHLI